MRPCRAVFGRRRLVLVGIAQVQRDRRMRSLTTRCSSTPDQGLQTSVTQLRLAPAAVIRDRVVASRPCATASGMASPVPGDDRREANHRGTTNPTLAKAARPTTVPHPDLSTAHRYVHRPHRHARRTTKTADPKTLLNSCDGNAAASNALEDSPVRHRSVRYRARSRRARRLEKQFHPVAISQRLAARSDVCCSAVLATAQVRSRSSIKGQYSLILNLCP